MRSTFLCLFLLLSIGSYAQKKSPLYPGYVVTLENDTLRGKIKRGLLEQTGEFTGVVFFPDEYGATTGLSKKMRYPVQDLLGYKVADNPYTRVQLKEVGNLFMREDVVGPISLYYGETFVFHDIKTLP